MVLPRVLGGRRDGHNQKDSEELQQHARGYP